MLEFCPSSWNKLSVSQTPHLKNGANHCTFLVEHQKTIRKDRSEKTPLHVASTCSKQQCYTNWCSRSYSGKVLCLWNGLMPPGPSLRSLWFMFSIKRSFVFAPQLNDPSLPSETTHPPPSATPGSLSTEGLWCERLGTEWERSKEVQRWPLQNVCPVKWKSLLFTSAVQRGSNTDSNVL